MITLGAIEAEIDSVETGPDRTEAAGRLIALGEQVLEHWIIARGETPTNETREGFRLLALHRQGSKGEPSFNACRETCREMAYHYNLITMQPKHPDTGKRLAMLRMICNHLFLFISGKMQAAELGDFCCSSKPLRLTPEEAREREET